MTRSKFIWVITLFFLPGAFLRAQVSTPPIGIARFSDASVRNVYGLPQNLIVDSNSFGSFDAASFSDEVGLVAVNGQIQLIKPDFTVIGEYDSADSRILVNVDTGPGSAIAWLPTSQSLVHWNGAEFAVTSVVGLDPSMRVTAVRVQRRGRAQFLLMERDRSVFEASVSLETGNVLSLRVLPGVYGHALWQASSILFEDANGLELMGPDGSVQTLGVTARDVEFARMSSTWILVSSRSQGRIWALHIGSGDISLSELPGVPSQVMQ